MPVPLEDVKVAVTASDDIYHRSRITPGEIIPGTSYKVIKIVTPTLKGEPLKAFVATSGSTTLICFSGTRSPRQLMQQFLSSMRPRKLLRYRGKTMWVLNYFWDALSRFSPEKLVPGGIRAGQKYIITGHSLGGALASLFSIHMRMKHKGIWENPRSSLITFGAPRVGDSNFAKVHDALISPNRKLRFIYGHDIVPHFPTSFRFKHHSREVWIWRKWLIDWFKVRRKTLWTVCKKGDDPSHCSHGLYYKQPYSHLSGIYRQAVFTRPDVFYDRNGKPRKSFTGAQCR